jgi:hypothetical protein
MHVTCDLIQPPLVLGDVFRAAAVLACWPRCFDASVEAYASRDPTF